jgi:hypothetical protein
VLDIYQPPFFSEVFIADEIALETLTFCRSSGAYDANDTNLISAAYE